MLDPQRMYYYNIILSFFVGLFVLVIIYYFMGKNKIIVLNDNDRS